jgi:hypothetical protein
MYLINFYFIYISIYLYIYLSIHQYPSCRHSNRKRLRKTNGFYEATDLLTEGYVKEIDSKHSTSTSNSNHSTSTTAGSEGLREVYIYLSIHLSI